MTTVVVGPYSYDAVTVGPACAIVISESVTTYATVAELRTASEGSLASGYYQTGDQIVYWDGVEFTPYLTAAGTIPYIEPLETLTAPAVERMANADKFVVTPDFDITTELSGLGIETGSWSLV